MKYWVRHWNAKIFTAIVVVTDHSINSLHIDYAYCSYLSCWCFIYKLWRAIAEGGGGGGIL